MDVPEYETDHLVQVSLDRDGDHQPDAVIRATREHPFWTLERDWVFAIDLQPGERCLSADGQPMTVTSTTVQEAPERAVYNLTISGDHSFFVQQGGCSVLVHNTNQVARQWIVYMIELDTPPEESKRFYVGRASQPANNDRDVSAKDVWQYRAGQDGSRHHIWSRKGKGAEFMLPKLRPDGTSKVHIISSFFENDFKTGYHTCRAIEHNVYFNLKGSNQHDLNQNEPLGRQPAAKKAQILSTSSGTTRRSAPLMNLQTIKLRCP